MKKHKYKISCGIGLLFVWFGIAQMVTYPIMLIVTGGIILFMSMVTAMESE